MVKEEMGREMEDNKYHQDFLSYSRCSLAVTSLADGRAFVDSMSRWHSSQFSGHHRDHQQPPSWYAKRQSLDIKLTVFPVSLGNPIF